MNRFLPVEELTIADLEQCPVWQFVNAGGPRGVLVRPVKKTPVSSLRGRVVGTRVQFASGELVWGILGNVDEENVLLTQHFATLSLNFQGRWVRLARYHDYDYSEYGPSALARTFGLEVDKIFPITYNLRRYSEGDDRALIGKITKEPAVRLSRDEIIALAVP